MIYIYRFLHWIRKHKYEDYSLRVTLCYFCETCGLQKTLIGHKYWWYRYAPWIKRTDEEKKLLTH